MPCPGDRKYRQGLKPLCLFVLNGTTKVVPSRRSESCALPLRPQVPLGLKPRCLFVLNGTTKVVPSHRKQWSPRIPKNGETSAAATTAGAFTVPLFTVLNGTIKS